MILLSLIATKSHAQAKMVKLDNFLEMVQTPSDKIKVINFWATWCAPCIKEIPLFEKLNQSRTDVEVTLVSMDIDQDSNPEKIYKFINRKKILSSVLILDEKNPKSWITRVDKAWSGNIPVTLVVNTTNGKRRFVERELKDGELEQLIDGVK